MLLFDLDSSYILGGAYLIDGTILFRAMNHKMYIYLNVNIFQLRNQRKNEFCIVIELVT